MQIPILNGIYTDGAADMRAAYPINLMPVVEKSGISNGYLRPADGIQQFGSTTFSGTSRGAINWQGQCYRVIGSKLYCIGSDGSAVELGIVGGTGQARLDYSIDRLAVASNGKLYYWDESTFDTITVPGGVVDFCWIDGYFLATDGQFFTVSSITDPTNFSLTPPFDAAQADPDPVVSLVRVRNEVYAVNRYTIEIFESIQVPDTSTFPFRRVEGAQIQKGALGTFCVAELDGAVVFLGSGRNESPSVYVGGSSQAQKISTREIDSILAGYTEAQLAQTVVETRVDRVNKHVWFRLPDRTLVYDVAVSRAAGSPVWFTLTSSTVGYIQYRAKDIVWCYDKWLVGDTQEGKIGSLTNTLSTQYNNKIRWEFGTGISYNKSRGAIFHELELVSLTGRTAFGLNPRISTSYSVDGTTWSQEEFIDSGEFGDRRKRLVWYQQGYMSNFRMQRFKGDSDSFLSMARLEAQIEPLSV